MSEDPLGPDYEARTLPNEDGSVGTLVRLPCRSGEATRGAILYVHGYVDYYFHGHIAEHFAAEGYDFYGLDLRRSGRSIRPGDLRFYFRDLREWDEELDASIEELRADGHRRITLMAHSTGGLAVPLWLVRRNIPEVCALVLSSPWLDLQEPWITRTLGTQLIHALAAVRPETPLPVGISPAAFDSIHASAKGEWNYNLDWKPLRDGPVYAGVLSAVRRGHAELHRGVGLNIPILLLHASLSKLRMKNWTEDAQRHDVVLDVKQMLKWAPKLGPKVKTVAIEDGMHDLFLARKEIREQVLHEIDSFLDALADAPAAADAGTEES